MLSFILSAIGLITVASFLFKTASFISIYLRPSRLSRYAHPSKDGKTPWALVTGSSDGIGTEFARELASQGFNVVLHGRNRAKLSGVMSQLEEAFPKRSFRLLVADASRVACGACYKLPAGSNTTESVDFEAIRAALDDINLTVLINNVGGGVSNPVYSTLAEDSETRITDTVSLNATFPLQLTRVLLPNLIRNAPALVLNVSSMGDLGFPLLVSYCASKAFVMNFNKAVGLEMGMEGRDVEVLGIRVGKVTGTSGYKFQATTMVPTAETMARAALARVGHGSRIVIGYWAHGLQGAIIESLPGKLRDRVFVAAMQREKDAEVRLGKRG